MIIEFRVVKKNTQKFDIDENTSFQSIFMTPHYVSEKTYDTISRIFRQMLIADNKISDDEKIIKKILQGNTITDISEYEISVIDEYFLKILKEIEIKNLCIKQNPYMN